jgi:hypothetical protein
VTFVIVGFHQKAVSTRSRVLTANADTIGPDEEFDLIDCGGGLLAVRDVHGRFLCATPDGTLHANSDEARDWEMFRLVPGKGGRLGLLTHHRLFVSASPEGALEANRTWLRDWEEFYLYSLPNVDEFSPVSQRGDAEVRAPTIFERCANEPETACRDAIAAAGGITFPLPASAD